ncbi:MULTISPECIES: hypothetical protein [Bacillus]|nr:hypothetical protein [Bacillus rhizoplanae]
MDLEENFQREDTTIEDVILVLKNMLGIEENMDPSSSTDHFPEVTSFNIMEEKNPSQL